MSLLGIDETSILVFYLVFLRVIAFWMTWPVLSGVNVPTPIKILLSVLISFLLLPAVLPGTEGFVFHTSTLVVLSMKELFLGMILGFICRLFTFGVSMGGHLVSLSMGLAQGQLYNPQIGHQANPLEQFYLLIASIFFLLIQGHHLFLSGFAMSFTEIHVLSMVQLGEGMGKILPFFFGLMTVCVQIAAPILVTILFLNLSMGIIGRAVPQINVLITSLSVNILAGFVVVMISLPLAIGYITNFHYLVAEQFFGFIKGF